MGIPGETATVAEPGTSMRKTASGMTKPHGNPRAFQGIQCGSV